MLEGGAKGQSPKECLLMLAGGVARHSWLDGRGHTQRQNEVGRSALQSLQGELG
jgi:hypothetical protein